MNTKQFLTHNFNLHLKLRQRKFYAIKSKLKGTDKLVRPIQTKKLLTQLTKCY